MWPPPLCSLPVFLPWLLLGSFFCHIFSDAVCTRDGLRSTATPKQKGLCAHCGGELLAKCGSRVVWHWAHANTENCDSWYEPETAWHRNWKEHFGKDCSEISVVKNEKRHIADVLTGSGLVVEFQNSPISADTIHARETFYEKMIWVMNGEGFKDKFRTFDKDYYQNWKFSLFVETEFYHPLLKEKVKAVLVSGADLQQPAARNILLQQGFSHEQAIDRYFYVLHKSENFFAVEARVEGAMLKLFRQSRPEPRFKPLVYEWSNPRLSWTDAKAPVFIDLGDDYLVLIKTNMGQKAGEALKVPKKEFLKKYAV